MNAANRPAPPHVGLKPDLLLSSAMVHEARRLATQTGATTVEALEQLSELDRGEFMAALGVETALPVIDERDLHAWQPAFERLPFSVALKRQCAAFHDSRGALRLVLTDPFDGDIYDWASATLAAPFAAALIHPVALNAFFESARHEHNNAEIGLALSANELARASEGLRDISLRSLGDDESPVVRCVNALLYDAYQAHASDVHVESTTHGLAIRQRLDGVLIPVDLLPGTEFAEQVISRIKVMAALDIAERRVPQDGRFQVSIQGRAVDFRVSIMPSVHGEDAVLRLLDKQALADELTGLRLDSLGFDASALTLLRRLIAEPYGMVLVTGPTGSGKTTTLYAAITEINRGEDKIITIEDPVEYQLPGVLQIPVNEKKGLTFGRGLRSILRHDPDKIMVGEIRDPETAQIAVQAALTGHLVLTTVHANNVFDVISRFLHMGIEPHSLVGALNGVLAQRLVRLNCPQCTAPATPTAQILRDSGLSPEVAQSFAFRAGQGCPHCRGCGYRGRKAIAEMLRFDDELRDLIGARASLRQLKEAAHRKGLSTLRAAALDCVRRGETTLEEINRVSLAV